MDEHEVIKIFTYNCNGINDLRKRKDVFDFLRKQKGNVYFLQETHLPIETEKIVRAGWGFDCYVAGKETNKNGVAILFSNSIEYKVFNVIRDPDGCFLILDVEIQSKRIT